MPETSATIQLLSPEGRLVENAANEELHALVRELDEAQLRRFHRDMSVTRRFDVEAANLQRQGQMGLWVPSFGQEAAQVGSAHARRRQDHVFPSYREHAVALANGVDLVDIIELLRGNTHGGWDPKQVGNFHLYTLVIGSQALHANGYAMGIGLDGAHGSGDVERDEAVIVYFGDGATSQGDVSEAFVFAASYNTPQVFFLQNNHWAISVPVERQSRTPLYLRSTGFGIPAMQIDGNDVLASWAATRVSMDAARTGQGPRFIEALTYRIGAHTSSDDPTKYRDGADVDAWRAKDPIARFETYLRGLGTEESFFEEVREEAEAVAADARARTLAMTPPDASVIFDHVYTDPHPLVAEQKAWLERYEASYGENA